MATSKRAGKPAKNQDDADDVWAAAGIEEQDITVPFFGVESKWTTCTVVTLRKPTKEEAWRKLEGKDPFPVFAILDVVDDQGQDRRWEISSKLLLAQLRKIVKRVPQGIEVRSKGNPPRRIYEVRPCVARLDVQGDQDVKGGKYVNGERVA